MYVPPRKKLNKALIIDKDRLTERQMQNTVKMPKEQHKLGLLRNFSQLRFELFRPKSRYFLLVISSIAQMVNSRSHD